MKKKYFINECRLQAPIRQEFEISRRYDREWKTHFVVFTSTSISPKDEKDSHPISEEIVMCVNNKKEATELLNTIKKVLRGIK